MPTMILGALNMETVGKDQQIWQQLKHMDVYASGYTKRLSHKQKENLTSF